MALRRLDLFFALLLFLITLLFKLGKQLLLEGIGVRNAGVLLLFGAQQTGLGRLLDFPTRLALHVVGALGDVLLEFQTLTFVALVTLQLHIYKNFKILLLSTTFR